MIFTIASNNSLNIIQMKSQVKIVYEDFNSKMNDSSIRINLTKEDIKKLIKLLESCCTQAIKKEDKAYTEEINTFRDEVERTLTIGSNGKLDCSLDLICYTDKPYDDNWIILTQKKLAYLIGLLYGYVEN